MMSINFDLISYNTLDTEYTKMINYCNRSLFFIVQTFYGLPS